MVTTIIGKGILVNQALLIGMRQRGSFTYFELNQLGESLSERRHSLTRTFDPSIPHFSVIDSEILSHCFGHNNHSVEDTTYFNVQVYR